MAAEVAGKITIGVALDIGGISVPISRLKAGLDVLSERERQVVMGYDAEHDDTEGVAHLMGEAHYRLGHQGEFSSPEATRAELVKVAALALAAIEVLDREEARNGR